MRAIILTPLIILVTLLTTIPVSAKIETGIEQKTTKIDLAESHWFWSSNVTAEDNCFYIEWDKDEVIDIRSKSSTANYRDFVAFTTALYRKILSEKLKGGQSLSKGEIDVLKICVRAQINLIKECSLVFLDNILPPHTEEVKLKKSEIVIPQTHAKLINVENLTNKNNTNKKSDILFSTIIDFARIFTPTPSSTIKTDLKNISERNYNPEKVDRYSHLDINPQKTADLWRLIHNTMSFYKDDLRLIYSDLNAFRKTTERSTNIKAIEDLLLTYEIEMRTAIRENDMLFNDFPFVVATYRAYDDYNKSKGTFRKNKRALKDAINKYITLTAAPDMLKNIRSIHSSHLYTTLMEKYKGGLRKDWEPYRLATKIYKIDSFAEDCLHSNKISHM